MISALFVKYKLPLIALSYLVIFAAGWNVCAWKEDSQDLKETKQTVQLTRESIKKSDEIEHQAIDRKDQIQIQYKTVTKEIVKYVPKTVYDKCVAEDGTVVATTLNVAAVSVLNADKEGPGIQPSGLSDAQGEAPTEVGLQELSQHVAELKKAYDELAVDHDSLVEYNAWYKSQLP